MTEALELEVTVDPPAVPASPRHTPVKIQVVVRAKKVPESEASSSDTTTVCMLVDCTSLNTVELTIVVSIAKRLVDGLPDGQVISLVALQTKAKTWVKKAGLDAGRRHKIHRLLDRLRSGGASTIPEGIKLCIEAFDKVAPGARILIALGGATIGAAATVRRLAAVAADVGGVLFVVDVSGGAGVIHPGNSLDTVVRTPDAETAIHVFLTFEQRLTTLLANQLRLEVVFEPQVRPGLAYRTKPKRAYLGPLTTADDRRFELTLGDLEIDTIHGYLLLLKAPPATPSESGQPTSPERQLARIKVWHDIPRRGRRAVCVERAAVVRYEDLSASLTEVEDTAPEPDHDSASHPSTPAQLVEELLAACRDGNQARAITSVEGLLARCDEAPLREMKEQFETMRQELESGNRLSRELIEACSLVPLRTAVPGRRFYDVVLLAVGEQPLLVARELRAATGLSLTEVAEMLKAPTTIAHGLTLVQAGALRRRLERVGARLEVRKRTETEGVRPGEAD